MPFSNTDVTHIPGPVDKVFTGPVTLIEGFLVCPPGLPVIVDIVETEWYGRITFVANLMWPDSQPGMAWVIQDRDFWLYVLDIRALDGGKIPLLIEEVASTFSFTE